MSTDERATDRCLAHDSWSLRKRDQKTIACILVVSLFAIVCNLSVRVSRHGVLDYRSGRRPIGLPFNSPRDAPAARFDLNQCTWQELCLLPGISHTLAKRIVLIRAELAGFRSIEELSLVPGIGERKIDSLRDEAQLVLVPPAAL